MQITVPNFLYGQMKSKYTFLFKVEILQILKNLILFCFPTNLSYTSFHFSKVLDLCNLELKPFCIKKNVFSNRSIKTR